MNWLNPYTGELESIFDECAQIIRQFPEPLNAKGAAYLSHFDPRRANSRTNYICYLLPFWLDPDGTERELARRLTAGNLFCMLYFFLQDDLMDDPDHTPAEALPLANLLFAEFLNIYRACFPGDSPFWSYFNRYWREWAASAVRERSGRYFIDDPLDAARKSSPLKITAAGMLQHAGRLDRLPLAEEAVDRALVTLQMLDDLEDWEEDLQTGSSNCLLSLVPAQSVPGESAAAHTLPAPEAVRTFIHVSGGLDAYASLAERQLALNAYAETCYPGLYAFHQDLTADLRRIARETEEEKQALMGGGFSYWLSKNMNSTKK